MKEGDKAGLRGVQERRRGGWKGGGGNIPRGRKKVGLEFDGHKKKAKRIEKRKKNERNTNQNGDSTSGGENWRYLRTWFSKKWVTKKLLPWAGGLVLLGGGDVLWWRRAVRPGKNNREKSSSVGGKGAVCRTLRKTQHKEEREGEEEKKCILKPSTTKSAS